ncbi:MAG: NADH-quinone oxidoreductase subunit A [Cyclobacteriaceae bacterium]
MASITGLQYILIFSGVGLGFILLTLLISRLISPGRPNPEKNSVYESGEETSGNSWPAISNGYFVIALLFLLFEIEIIFLIPLAIAFGKSSNPRSALILWGAISGFVIILVAGLAYAWINGHLDWMKPAPVNPESSGVVPKERYNEFNKKFS